MTHKEELIKTKIAEAHEALEAKAELVHKTLLDKGEIRKYIEDLERQLRMERGKYEKGEYKTFRAMNVEVPYAVYKGGVYISIKYACISMSIDEYTIYDLAKDNFLIKQNIARFKDIGDCLPVKYMLAALIQLNIKDGKYHHRYIYQKEIAERALFLHKTICDFFLKVDLDALAVDTENDNIRIEQK